MFHEHEYGVTDTQHEIQGNDQSQKIGHGAWQLIFLYI